MMCVKCNKDLVYCICPNAEERLKELSKSQYLDQRMITRIVEEREKAKKEHPEKFLPNG